MAHKSLTDVARAMDRSGLLTVERARVLQLAADPERPGGYKCSHPELAGMGWTHPWPDEPMTPHACCRDEEHCPAHWAR